MTREGQPDFRQFVVQEVRALGQTRRMVVFLLFEFLREQVAPFEEHNMMGERNLCIVFGPCLMRAPTQSIRDLMYAPKVITATNIIYNEYEAIFGGQEERGRIKRSSYKHFQRE